MRRQSVVDSSTSTFLLFIDLSIYLFLYLFVYPFSIYSFVSSPTYGVKRKKRKVYSFFFEVQN